MAKKLEFEKIISDNRYTISSLAKAIGITPRSLSNKINGETEFKVSEIISISHLLGLTQKELFNLFF